MATRAEQIERAQHIVSVLKKERAPDNFRPYADIAKDLGISRSSLIGVAHRHGFCKSQEGKQNDRLVKKARERVHEPRALSNAEHNTMREPSPPRKFSWET